MRYGGLSQMTRASREMYDPTANEENPARRLAPGAKISAQSFSAGGSAGERVRDLSSARSISNTMSSLKDARVGGLFAKDSVKDNWRADGGLVFKPKLPGALGVAGDTEGTSFLTQGDVIRKAASAPSKAPGESYRDQVGLLSKPLSADTRLEPLDRMDTYSFDGSAEDASRLSRPSETGSFSRTLDDYVFDGSMSNENRLQVMRVMNRRFGAEGVLR